MIRPSLLRTLACLGLATGLLTACVSDPQKSAAGGERTPEQQLQEEQFASGVNRKPTAQTMYAMARILTVQQRDAEAQQVFTQIVQEHPTFMPAYNDLAELYLRQRQLDKAIDVIDQGLAVSPDQPVLLNNKGVIYLVKGDYESALAWFTKATSLAPDNARYRGDMAVALGMLGRYDESLALYQQIAPPAEAHYNVGTLAEARNDAARATREFAIARQLEAAATQPRK